MPLRCLVVDDSRPFLAAARALLERQGLAVAGVAANGAEALQLAMSLRPDVVLVDIGLGDESGLDLVARLRAESAWSPPPVILILTRAQEDYADLIAGTGAIGFLPKLELSAAAVRDLIDGWAGDRSGRLSGPPEK